MNPIVTKKDINKNPDVLEFTLSGVNVSLANAIRRTILSDIPVVVFKTTPVEENKCNIITNTSKFNNEIIKQRLSCIPIHIKDVDNFPINNYLLEVNVENITNSIVYVTTKDFKIKDINKNNYIGESKLREIFPPCEYTGDHIIFARLKPKINDDIPGEKIHLTCEFSLSSPKENGMYNVVSTCSYGCSIDETQYDVELAKYMQSMKDEGLNKEEIDFNVTNWKLLNGKRIIKQDSFEFMLESIGIYTNDELLNKACEIIIEKFKILEEQIDNDPSTIETSKTTMKNSFDIILKNEDYTIGKSLEYILHTKYYTGIKTLTFCGFQKFHPHDNYSVIRLAYREPITLSGIKQNLKDSIKDAIDVFTKMQKEFLQLVK